MRRKRTRVVRWQKHEGRHRTDSITWEGSDEGKDLGQGAGLPCNNDQRLRDVDAGVVHHSHTGRHPGEQHGEVCLVVLEGAHCARPVPVLLRHAPLVVPRYSHLIPAVVVVGTGVNERRGIQVRRLMDNLHINTNNKPNVNDMQFVELHVSSHCTKPLPLLALPLIKKKGCEGV